MIKVKRVYEEVDKKDGYRVLVDRLWPRGIKKDDLIHDEWAKDLAPSSDLRKFFSHEKDKWKIFSSLYKKELKSSKESKERIKELVKKAKKSNVTLIYAAKDEEHNNAIILKEVIEKEISEE